MYTATQYDFRSSPDIRRNFPNPVVKTEEGPIRWLLGEACWGAGGGGLPWAGL